MAAAFFIGIPSDEAKAFEQAKGKIVFQGDTTLIIRDIYRIIPVHFAMPRCNDAVLPHVIVELSQSVQSARLEFAALPVQRRVFEAIARKEYTRREI